MCIKKDYFTIFDFMIKNLKLKDLKLYVFALIYSYSNNQNGFYVGSQKQMAEELCASEDSIFFVVKNLIDRNLILKVQNGIYQINQQKIDEIESLKCQFVNIRHFMIKDLKLKKTKLLLYAYIYSYSGDGKSLCNAHTFTLAQFCRKSKKTIYATIDRLLEKGLIVKKGVIKNRAMYGVNLKHELLIKNNEEKNKSTQVEKHQDTKAESKYQAKTANAEIAKRLKQAIPKIVFDVDIPKDLDIGTVEKMASESPQYLKVKSIQLSHILKNWERFASGCYSEFKTTTKAVASDFTAHNRQYTDEELNSLYSDIAELGF